MVGRFVKAVAWKRSCHLGTRRKFKHLQTSGAKLKIEDGCRCWSWFPSRNDRLSVGGGARATAGGELRLIQASLTPD